jgi:inner membrane protein
LDNLTHSLLAAALAKSPLGALHRRAAAIAVVAASLPDLDLLALFDGRPAYLEHHRGITHSLAGLALLAVAFAAAVHAFDRRRARRDPFVRRAEFGATAALVGAALASHFALDALNSYGVRPWLPLDASWHYADLAFIIDPWLWLLFGGAAALAGRRSRPGTVWLALAGAVCSAAIYASGAAPQHLRIAWPVGVAGIALARAAGVGSGRPARVLGASALATSLYVGALAACGARAESAGLAAIEAELAPNERVESSSREPRPADPRRWVVIADAGAAYYRVEVDLAAGAGAVARHEKSLEVPEVERALGADCARAWRTFARHPLAVVEHTPGAAWVELTDLRYDSTPGLRRRTPWCAVRVHVDESGAATCAGD